ncbi:MAG: aminotransferase class V-fold PLP-dependent enzyme [Phaeodactylibacter sp.]|nr:aminotransferase class V-fold PLP-dependent enzyme [Phaeodactylibacter sp.]
MDPTLTLEKETMRQLGYRAVDIIVDHTAHLNDKKVGSLSTREEMEAVFREAIPKEGMDPNALLGFVEKEVLPNITHLDHPRFFAFVPGPSNYMSVLAELLAVGFNIFSGDWLGAPAAAQIELVVIKWLTDLFQLPESAGGLFVSGGSMANLMALILAVHHKKQPGKVGVAYCSDQTHSCIERAVRILGKERVELRVIDTDERFSMKAEQLSRAIQDDKEKGRQPIAIVANAGTTNTGAVDDLKRIAEIREAENLWWHIDGAYGGVGILDERQRALYTGIEQADSIAIDPHKWWFQPHETACLLVRDQSRLRDVFYMMPEYLKDVEVSEEEVNYSNYGIQLTRGFRAFKLWMSLKTFGLDNFALAVKRGVGLAELAEREIRKYAGWEVVSPASLGIVTFQFQKPGWSREKANQLNQAIMDTMLKSGFAMLSSTTLQGRRVLRLCAINPRTTEEDIKEAINQLNRIAKTVEHATQHA